MRWIIFILRVSFEIVYFFELYQRSWGITSNDSRCLMSLTCWNVRGLWCIARRFYLLNCDASLFRYTFGHNAGGFAGWCYWIRLYRHRIRRKRSSCGCRQLGSLGLFPGGLRGCFLLGLFRRWIVIFRCRLFLGCVGRMFCWSFFISFFRIEV